MQVDLLPGELPLVQPVDRGLHPVGEGEDVGARLGLDPEGDPLLPVLEHGHGELLVADVDPGDIAQGDPPLAGGPEHHLLDLLDGVELAHGPDPVVPPADAHDPGRDVHVLGPERVDHLADRQAVGGELPGIDHDLHLPLGAAPGEEVGHALDPLQVLAYLVLEEGLVVVDRDGVAFDRPQDHPYDRRRGGARGGDHRLLHVLRVGGDLVELVGDPQQRVVHVGADPEPEGDAPPVVEGRALHLHEAGDPLEDLLLGLDDLPLDLVGGGPEPQGFHGYFRLGHRGAELVRHVE